MENAKPLPSYQNRLAASGKTPSPPSTEKVFKPEIGKSSSTTAPEFEFQTCERPPFISFGALSDGELREACYEYAAGVCCYGSSFVRDMILVDICNGYSFRYKLETFTEKRESVSTSTSYNGQEIDGPENGTPPDPWDIVVPTPTNFKDDFITKEIPHTAYVRQCINCRGHGKVTCSSCTGSRSETCSSCNGSGRSTESYYCSSCDRTGKRSCPNCQGSGDERCSSCSGTGRLKHYHQLYVTWKNQEDEFISDTMRLHPDLLKYAIDREILKEECTQVQPISHIPDSSVNEASARLINKHKAESASELQLKQRHTLWAIPVTKATYVWKKKQGEFYVYGIQKRVYFENYPQKGFCCPCC